MASVRSRSDVLKGCKTVTAIAIDNDKNSQSAFRWAVNDLIKEERCCVLVHVSTQSLHNPQNFEGAPREGRLPTEEELKLFFLPYRAYCARKGIVAKEVILHDIEVRKALLNYVSGKSIKNLVVGASCRGSVTRKSGSADIPTSLLNSAPENCAIYVISNEKPQSVWLPSQSRTATSNHCPPQEHPRMDILNSDAILRCLRCETSNHGINSITLDRVSSTMDTNSWKADNYEKSRSTRNVSPPASVASNSPGSSYNLTSTSNACALSGPPSFQSSGTSTQYSEHSILSTSSESYNSSYYLETLEAQVRRLKQELKHSMEMYSSACKDARSAHQRVSMLQKSKTEKAKKLREAKHAEEVAMTLVEKERLKTKAAMEAANMAQQIAEVEIKKRKNVETRVEELRQRKRNIKFRKYTIDEIEAATDYFSTSKKIGEGGYGPVFKGSLDHTPVAIKVLRPDISGGQSQFQQEVETLSGIRHPHMVILLGACPEYGCLVYEYMEYGSLDDRIFQKDNTPPIPWKVRFSIAAEVASGLLFLHQRKPDPLVHRDLKPANILLDRNYRSKICDVGLARLLPGSLADGFNEYHLTSTAGTFCYIDPEYQQSGMLGTKSDLYSLGIVLLQLITAKPAMGLTHKVQESIEKGTFTQVLDQSVTDCPVEDALSLAKLALKCTELRKRDRPDLATVILPELKRLRDTATAIGHQVKNSYKIYNAEPASTSIPQVSSQTNVRRKWVPLKFVSSIWKKIGSGNSASFVSTEKPIGKSNRKPQMEGCWSFVNCSAPQPQLRQYRSFA